MPEEKEKEKEEEIYRISFINHVLHLTYQSTVTLL
jgi:hypothetical protein